MLSYKKSTQREFHVRFAVSISMLHSPSLTNLRPRCVRRCLAVVGGRRESSARGYYGITPDGRDSAYYKFGDALLVQICWACGY